MRTSLGLRAQPEGPDAPSDDGALLVLVKTIEALSSARTVEEVAAVVRSSARRITGADGVAIILRDGDQCYYVDEDAIGPLWKGRRFPMTACVSGWAMMNRETAIIPDIYQDARVPHSAYRPTFVRSMVMTPVRPSDPIAAIGAYWAKRREPTKDELRKLEVMARATAAALESAQLRASLEAALAAREAMVHELDHRVKNTLAAALSIANQTLRNTTTPADFNETFEGRVFAMAAAHDLLSNADWGPVALEALAKSALQRFGGADGTRIAVTGPHTLLGPEAAIAMHMAIHELASNAERFGALKSPKGRVALYWSAGADVIKGVHVPTRLELVWRESGGPPVLPPMARGFGSRVIEQSLPRETGGEGTLLFDHKGVRFVLSAPLSQRVTLVQ